MILLQLIFFIGILLSVQHNNKLTLKLSVILLLFSIIFNCKRENYEEVLLNNGKYMCYKSNLPKSSVINQCDKLNNPMNIGVCMNKFNSNTQGGDNTNSYIKPCKNIGCILFDKTDNYEIITAENSSSIYNISDDNISNIRIYKNYELHLFTGKDATGERIILQTYDNNLYTKYIGDKTDSNVCTITSANQINIPPLYKEYNYTDNKIIDIDKQNEDIPFKIKSLKLVSIQNELFLEHKIKKN